MVKTFTPEANKVYFINEYSLFHVLSGTGTIEVDFRQYNDWHDKLLYLNKGQYIKFYSEDLVIRKITFSDEEVFESREFRVLFKHLISLGYINFNDCADCQKFLDQAIFTSEVGALIDISSEQWYWQNPFNANREEYHLIFDMKDIIDDEFKNRLTNNDLIVLLREKGYETMALVKDKIGLTVRNLLSNRRLLESQKELVFTGKSVKEIAYGLGYQDPSYFVRTFNKATGRSPSDFRSNFDFEGRDHFVQDIVSLIKKYHGQDRSLEFYANKMHLSVKTLSRKVRTKMNHSLGQLIRKELVLTAKQLLIRHISPYQIARQLNFEEPNHFSAFFKHYTGLTPTEFQKQKCNA